MKFNELELAKKAKGIRSGRGISAGRGKTAGRGTKGQRARTGKKLRAGFEGGQNPLMMRVPKLKGFKSKRIPAQVVYTGNLSLLKTKTADSLALFEAGLIASPYHKVKLISRGEVQKPFALKVQVASGSAVKAIEAAGGSVELVATLQRPATKNETTEK